MFLFFWTYMLDFADVSSPSLMGYGQSIYGPFTDLQRFSFIFRFFFGDSDGFSGPGLSHLNSDATVACEGALKGRLYRFRQHHEALAHFDAFAQV